MPGSIIPLRPLGVGELLDCAVRCVRSHARAIAPFAVPFAVVHAAARAGLQYASIGAGTGSVLLVLLGQTFVAVLLGVPLAAFLAPVFTGEFLGEQVVAGEAWRRTARLGGALVLLTLAVALAEEAGLVLLVVGGLWLWGVWAVAAPALVVERTTAGGALRRSVELVRTQFWRAWGVRALGWLVVTILGLLVTVPFTVLAGLLADTNPFSTHGQVGNPALYVTVNAVGAVVSLALVSPIAAAVDSLLYLDLRMRREGMDIVLTLPPQPAGVGV